ncbi:MAG TPA: exopolyphosphatase, partial [Gammaproteobacteria bacterium]|nr:exopolyphosphatase [Gammaproteobacteria bacterium]
MLLARIENEQIQIVDRYKEMVRLAGGLDEKHNLTTEAQAIALGCLERFGQRIEGLKPGNVRVVGTNALRQARNSSKFLTKAEVALGHSIDVISGMEEARLIYLGVAHSLPSDQGKRLVID